MNKFIRLDYDKNFRGTEHKSSFAGDGERFEKGISCYKINKDTIFDAIEDLYKYWTNVAGECDFTEFQITIFEGAVILREDGQKAYGADGEDLAECTNNDTVIKLDGSLFNEVYDLFIMNQNYKDGFTDDEPFITDDQLENKVIKLFEKYL